MTLGALSGGCKAVATALNAFRRRRTMQRVRREPLARGAGPHHTRRPPDDGQSRLDDSYTMGGMMVGDDSGDDCTAQDCVPFRKVAPSPLGLAVHSTLPSTTAAVHPWCSLDAVRLAATSSDHAASYMPVPVVRGHSPCLSTPATFGWSGLDRPAGHLDSARAALDHGASCLSHSSHLCPNSTVRDCRRSHHRH